MLLINTFHPYGFWYVTLIKNHNVTNDHKESICAPPQRESENNPQKNCADDNPK